MSGGMGKEIDKLKKENKKLKKDLDYHKFWEEARRTRGVELRDLVVSLRVEIEFKNKLINTLMDFDCKEIHEKHHNKALERQTAWMDRVEELEKS